MKGSGEHVMSKAGDGKEFRRGVDRLWQDSALIKYCERVKALGPRQKKDLRARVAATVQT